MSPRAQDGTHDEPHPIIVFDGLCVLCSAAAQFVLRHDRRGVFRLAAMQNAVGTALAERFGIDPADPQTIIVVRGATVLRDSDAIFDIAAGLGWPWRGIALFAVVPRPIRDRLYRYVARNRYRLFGRRATCWLPDSTQAARIL